MQWNQAAIHYINQGESQKAIVLCQQVLKRQPQLIQAYKIWGKALQKQKDYQATIQCYAQALTLQPDDSEIYLELGHIYQQQQQWQDAILSYQTVIRLQPECVAAYRQLGQILIQLNKWQAAINIYQKLIQLNPQVSWFYNHLGKALMKQQRWQEAIHAYQTSVELNPDFCWSYYHLGQCFINLEKWQAAENILKKAIQIHSSNALLFQALGDVLQHQNKENEAILLYQKLIRLNPCIAYYITLGKLYIKQQQLEKAIEVFMQALQFKPNFYPAFALLGDLLKQQDFTLESLQCQRLIKIPNFWVKKYLNLPDDYITDTQSNSNIQRDVIYPASTLQVSPPKTLGDEIPTRFEIKQATLTEAFIATIANGRVWNDSLTNTVITSNHQIVSDLSDGSPEVILSSDHIPSALELEGTVAFLSVQFGLVYYHWMIDILPRVALLQQQGLYKKIDYFVVNRYQTAYEKETFKMFGISQNKIIESTQFPHITASHFIIPSRMRDSATLPPWAIESLRQFILSDSSYHFSCSDRLYISRTQAKKRKMINEEAIIDLLKQYEFRIVYFEKMSVREQANCIATAEVVIAPHGSGLTNLIFCQPGTKVIEILSPSWLNSCYWMLSQTCQLDYFCLVGEASIENSENFPQYQAYDVNIQKLQQLMELAEVI
jgi:tetratricopeptide (TPR) repeat protein/capsular polysaccharide biosynthesis protein